MGLLAERLPDQLEARAATEPVIDQVDVVVDASPISSSACSASAAHSISQPRAVLLAEQVARHDEVVLVVLDDQDADPLSGWPLPPGRARAGSSTISNQ